MDNKYGSLWNKWDFHVHTPYSILNNNYGFNPFTVTDEEENEKIQAKLTSGMRMPF